MKHIIAKIEIFDVKTEGGACKISTELFQVWQVERKFGNLNAKCGHKVWMCLSGRCDNEI
jgi:hypothetical protein